jgi:hypothetical protein
MTTSWYWGYSGWREKEKEEQQQRQHPQNPL